MDFEFVPVHAVEVYSAIPIWRVIDGVGTAICSVDFRTGRADADPFERFSVICLCRHDQVDGTIVGVFVNEGECEYQPIRLMKLTAFKVRIGSPTAVDSIDPSHSSRRS